MSVREKVVDRKAEEKEAGKEDVSAGEGGLTSPSPPN
jgi:hypothetical protein